MVQVQDRERTEQQPDDRTSDPAPPEDSTNLQAMDSTSRVLLQEPLSQDEGTEEEDESAEDHLVAAASEPVRDEKEPSAEVSLEAPGDRSLAPTETSEASGEPGSAQLSDSKTDQDEEDASSSSPPQKDMPSPTARPEQVKVENAESRETSATESNDKEEVQSEVSEGPAVLRPPTPRAQEEPEASEVEDLKQAAGSPDPEAEAKDDTCEDAFDLKECSVRLEKLMAAPPVPEAADAERAHSPRVVTIRLLPKVAGEAEKEKEASKETEEYFLSSIMKENNDTDDGSEEKGPSPDLVDAFSLVSADATDSAGLATTTEAEFQTEGSDPVGYAEVTSDKNHSVTLEQEAQGDLVSEEASVCNICNKNLPTYQELLLHKRRHKVTEALICPYCAREYFDRNRYDIHIRWHTGETPFKCTICGKGFREQRKLKLHIRRHNSDLGHKCHLCPRSFEGARSLAKHLLAHKNNTYVAPKVFKKADGSVALAMPPDPNQRKAGSTQATENVETPLVTISQAAAQPSEETSLSAEPPEIPIRMMTSTNPSAVLVSPAVASPTPAPATATTSLSVPPAEQATTVTATEVMTPTAAASAGSGADAVAVEAGGSATVALARRPTPTVTVLAQDTISLSMDELMQYATPAPNASSSSTLIHEHHADLEERLTETATTTLPVGMDEFNMAANVAPSATPSKLPDPSGNLKERPDPRNDSGDFPDLLDSENDIADLEYKKFDNNTKASPEPMVNEESGLTFTTLSGVSPEYPEGKGEEQQEKSSKAPVVVARKSVAPDPTHEPSNNTKTEEIIKALASEAAAQLAKANITLPAGTCLVPASPAGGTGEAKTGSNEKSSLQVLPAVLTANATSTSSHADIAMQNKPMTITIQYKVFPDQGQPQTIAVKKSLSELISEAPPERAVDSSSASSASSTPIPPVLTAVKTQLPSLPSPTPSPDVQTVVTKAPTPSELLSTAKVPPIEDPPAAGPDPSKETRTEVTPAGNKFEVPTIVTSGYDLDTLMCTICNRVFKNDKTLMGHMLNHFGVAPKMAHCPLCGLTLQKKSYARHLRLHGDVVPEICPYCQKGFRERRSLDKHIKAVHHAERPFACEYCPERFVTQEEQRGHHQGHMKGYPYQCQVRIDRSNFEELMLPPEPVSLG